MELTVTELTVTELALTELTVAELALTELTELTVAELALTELTVTELALIGLLHILYIYPTRSQLLVSVQPDHRISSQSNQISINPCQSCLTVPL